MKVLNFEVLKEWPHVDQSHPMLQSLDDIVSWKVDPAFSRSGRSAFLYLEEPVKVPTPNGTVEIERLKIKGVGLCDFDGNLTQPCSDHFPSIVPHLGISREGGFFIVPFNSRPMGGLVLEKASMEFTISDILYKNDVPAEIPIKLYRYTDPELHFIDKGGSRHDLGVVVAGQHNRIYDRTDLILDYDIVDEDTKRQLDRLAELMEVDVSEDRELSLLTAIYKTYGHYIKKYSMSGLYRHSGHPSNLGFSCHTKSIYFTDIDSCRLLSECSEIETPIQVMRDALSGTYNLFSNFTDSIMVPRFSSERVLKSGIFRKFLESYYDDLPKELVAGISGLFEEQFAEYHAKALAMINEQENQSPGTNKSDTSSDDKYTATYCKQWHRVETDYHVIYSWLLAIHWTLHSKSAIGETFPFKQSEEQYYQNIAEFSSPELVATIRSRIADVL